MTAQAGDITRTPSAKGALRRRLPGSLAWHIGALALSR